MRAIVIVATVVISAYPVLGDEAADVSRYELTVVVHPKALSVRTILTTSAKTLRLELAPEMQVREATVAGKKVACRREGDHVVVDLPRTAGGSDAVRLEIAAEGAPREQFSRSRGGFLRSAVTPERTWVRSQVPWYPRVAGGRGAYRVAVDVPRGWKVRTAGRPQPVASGERDVWTYETDGAVRGIGLVAGPYEVRNLKVSEHLQMEAWTLPGDEAGAPPLLDVARQAFTHYLSWFGDVEVSHFSLVEMPAAFGVGSGYGEDGYVLVGSGAFANGSSAPWAAALVAHEVAHTWWGREVSFLHFASESLASYATLRYVEETAGKDAARRERARAVERVVKAGEHGKEIALADIRDFGAGMDPETYRVHAYEKGMMLLVMIEDAIGSKAMDEALRKFLASHRGQMASYPELRAALSAAGARARAVLDQWEQPGIPRLDLDHSAKRSGKSWYVRGTVTQQGTRRPFRMRVAVVAQGGEPATEQVKLSGKKATFRIKVPDEPTAVVLDPDYRLLVAAPRSALRDVAGAIDEAFAIVNNPGEADRAKCERAVKLLREVLDAGAGEREGLCHTGIGRCLFRLGRLDEAVKSLEKAIQLGAGGPFHRAWAQLRLGCIADLRHKRKEAIAHYRKAQSRGASGHTAQLASRFMEHPYRGHDRDG